MSLQQRLTDLTQRIRDQINVVTTQVRGINTRTANYTLTLPDAGRVVEMNMAGANTLTIPNNTSVAFPLGTRIDIVQYGAGQTTIAPAGGVTLVSEGNKRRLFARYVGVSIYKRGTNEWVLIGSIVT